MGLRRDRARPWLRNSTSRLCTPQLASPSQRPHARPSPPGTRPLYPSLTRFVGRLVGKALYDGQLIDAYFTRSFYKHMLGQVGGGGALRFCGKTGGGGAGSPLGAFSSHPSLGGLSTRRPLAPLLNPPPHALNPTSATPPAPDVCGP
jgi:hypothetical protein